MSMVSVGAILLVDLHGTKCNYQTGSATYLSIDVLRGELLLEMKQESPPFNHALGRDASICLFCDEDDVAPLNKEEYLLLEAIQRPCDRLDTFSTKLEWGVHLKEGDSVCVTVRVCSVSVESCHAIVHYKGQVGSLPGINFGVEIMQEKHRTASIGTTDGTFQDKRYFGCDDGCGLFMALHLMTPTDSTLSLVTNPRELNHLSRRKKSNSLPGYSGKDPSLYGQTVPQHYIDQRVMFSDKQGVTHYGTIHWIGKEGSSKQYMVGIKTVQLIMRKHKVEGQGVKAQGSIDHVACITTLARLGHTNLHLSFRSSPALKVSISKV